LLHHHHRIPTRRIPNRTAAVVHIFAQDKDDVVLYLHTDIVGMSGVNCLDIIKSLNKIRIRFLDKQGWSQTLKTCFKKYLIANMLNYVD
jgi:hypothetical protein